ncbi:DNA repair protein [Trinickia symbiotica]|uniref:DNA repair protein n=1 Tax=Trinickia symbiotica TaxID=863227 RepID=A0A2T3XZI7_9BURK|nr:DUF488 domain-containing protein [Trinickia symbiotica]PTB21901.1 DNA repair protein [Trinickia symbiotica]
MSQPFFTIGHSTRSLTEFIGLLKDSGVELLVDVRSFARSRTNPQFNEETLPGALQAEGIGYLHLKQLGGRRGKASGAHASSNAYWTHPAFRNYADYATTETFSEGLRTLIELGSRQRCAIMCSEAVWWRCHRRIIADYLLARHKDVRHIMDAHHVTSATMTPAARPQSDGTLLYPPEDQE